MNQRLTQIGALSRLILKLRAMVQDARVLVPSLPEREEAPELFNQLRASADELERILQQLGTSPPKGGLFRRSLSAREKASEDEPVQMQVSGDAIPVPDLLNFLAQTRKTGVLWIITETETFVLELIKGRLARATSDSTPEGLRLGEILVRQGAISQVEIQDWIDEARGAGEELGTALVEMGRIGTADLRLALEKQILALFRRIMKAPAAVCRFLAGNPLPCPSQLDLNMVQFLLEAAREEDEEAREATPEPALPAPMDVKELAELFEELLPEEVLPEDED